MSKIKSENTTIDVYSPILEKAISDVKKKVQIDDDEIEWIIFDEKNYVENKVIGRSTLPSFVYPIQYKYGFCNVDKKQIYISTAAIRTYNNDFYRQIPYITKNFKQNNILLIDVILDELAHIKTGKNHGDKKYDNTLGLYRNKYYSFP